MRNLILSVKRYLAFAILILVLLILLWLRFFVTPQVPKEVEILSPTPNPTPPENLLTNVNDVPQSLNILPDTKAVFNYTGNTFLNPSNLPVYAPSEPTKVSLQNASLYAAKFDITSQPIVSETNANGAPFYLWQEENKVFSIGGSFPAISFNDYSFFEHVSSPEVIAEDLLISRAKEELQKLSIENIDYNSPTFFYYKTSPNQITNEVELEPTANKSGASYVGIGFSYKLNDYLITSNAPFNLPVFLIFDAGGRLFELTAYLFSPSTTTATTSVLPFNEVLKQLNKRGVIFSALSEKDINQKEVPFYNLKTVNLTSVEIKYYLPINFINSISPYYVFSGTGIDNNTKEIVAVTVLLPIN